jgi:hypothetical protein
MLSPEAEQAEGMAMRLMMVLYSMIGTALAGSAVVVVMGDRGCRRGGCDRRAAGQLDGCPPDRGLALQKDPDRLFELPRFLGVKPVARTRDLRETRLGEQGADRLAVFGPDIVAFRPGQE